MIRFDPVEERRLLWKIDLYVVPIVSLLYLLCFIDRANIGKFSDPLRLITNRELRLSKGNARLAGLEKDLGLKGYDFNIVLSVFYISYALLEVPCNLVCKWVGPGWFLPAITLGFGICTVAFAFVKDRSAACGVRFLLGVFESGSMPGIAYYLSRWYRRSELTFRLALYIIMAPLAGAFGGLLASASLTLDHFGSTKRWQMIFAIEGIITIGVSLLAFVIMTDRPETARWLNENEKVLAMARLKSERVGTKEVLDKIDTTKLVRGIVNPVTLTTSMIFFMCCITVQGLAFFMPTIIRTIYPKSSAVYQQLMTVPPYVVGAFFVLTINYTSWKIDRRNVFIAYSAIPVVAGYIMFLASTNPKVRYGATFIITAGAYSSGALGQSQVSANVVSDSARSVAIGFTVMSGNIGGLLATWTFLPFDAPNYHIGNGLNLAAQATVFVAAASLEFWMRWDNKKREQRDIVHEVEDLTDAQLEKMDWHHPSFLWRP